MKKPTVVLAADDAALRRRVRALLQPQGCEVFEAFSADDACRFAHRQRPDLIVLGPFGSGAWDELHTAQEIRQGHRRVPLTLIPAQSTEALAIAARRAGITDCFTLPSAFDELESSIKRCLAGIRARASSSLGDPHAPGATPLQRMIGESLPMHRVKAYVGQVAMTDSAASMTGGSRTGKELVAEMTRHLRPIRRSPTGACPRHRTAIA